MNTLNSPLCVKVSPTPGGGNLRAIASVNFKAGGIPIELHFCRIIQQPGQRPYVHLPQSDNHWPGYPKFHPVIRFPKEITDSIKEAVLLEWKRTQQGVSHE